MIVGEGGEGGLWDHALVADGQQGPGAALLAVEELDLPAYLPFHLTRRAAGADRAA